MSCAPSGQAEQCSWLSTDLTATLPTWCCSPASDLQSPKHFQVGVWTCIPNLVSTGGTLLVLVSTVKTAHTTSETQEPRGEKHSPRKELTVKYFCSDFKSYIVSFQEGQYTFKDATPHGAICNCLEVSKYINITLQNSVKQRLWQWLGHISWARLKVHGCNCNANHNT